MVFDLYYVLATAALQFVRTSLESHSLHLHAAGYSAEFYGSMTYHLRRHNIMATSATNLIELKRDGRSYEVSSSQLSSNNIGLMFGVS